MTLLKSDHCRKSDPLFCRCFQSMGAALWSHQKSVYSNTLLDQFILHPVYINTPHPPVGSYRQSRSDPCPLASHGTTGHISCGSMRNSVTASGSPHNQKVLDNLWQHRPIRDLHIATRSGQYQNAVAINKLRIDPNRILETALLTNVLLLLA